MSQSFFSIVRDAVLEERAANQREKLRANFAKKYEIAKKSLDSGHTQEMTLLGNSSLGDAWKALAEYYANSCSLATADRLATEAFAKAISAQFWINNSSPNYLKDSCQTQYETRWFLGIGTNSDHFALFEHWKNEFKSGEKREVGMAWLCTYGPPEVRDYKAAWFWLCLGEARWGEGQTPPTLPTGNLLSLQEHLVGTLSRHTREHLQKESERRAYEEFVMGK